MGVFSLAGGTVLESWKCAQDGPLGALPSILRPLDFCKSDLLVLTGLSQTGERENVNAHEHCSYTHLTGANKVGREGGKIQAAVSVDQAAAEQHAGDTFLPSLEIGLNLNQYSFDRAGTPIRFRAKRAGKSTRGTPRSSPRRCAR